MAHQEFEQREFLRAKLDLLAVPMHGMGDPIDDEVFHGQHRFGRTAAAT